MCLKFCNIVVNNFFRPDNLHLRIDSVWERPESHKVTKIDF